MTDNASFLRLTSKADIDRLIQDGIEEGLNLDYKSSPALSRNSKEVGELCKDVSAFANSAGGQIIYGVQEDKHTAKPVDTDPGVTDPKIDREWIERVINSNVQPRISGIQTARIDNGWGGFIYVITIPQSQTGPHQAPEEVLQAVRSSVGGDGIRDVLSRATSPSLEPELTFSGKTSHRPDWARDSQTSEPFSLTLSITNQTSVPALYTILTMGFDTSLLPTVRLPLITIGQRTTKDGTTLNWYQRKISVPNDFPIFKEAPFYAMPADCYFVLPEHALNEIEFDVYAIIQCPGFDASFRWTILNQRGSLSILPES